MKKTLYLNLITGDLVGRGGLMAMPQYKPEDWRRVKVPAPVTPKEIFIFHSAIFINVIITFGEPRIFRCALTEEQLQKRRT